LELWQSQKHEDSKYNNKLAFGYIGNAIFPYENPGAFRRKPDAETMTVVIPDKTLQSLAVGQDYCNFGMRINQRFKVSGFGPGMFRVHEIADILMSPGAIGMPPVDVVVMIIEVATFKKGHKTPANQEFRSALTIGLITYPAASSDRSRRIDNPLAPGTCIKLSHSQTRINHGKQIVRGGYS
jgi:hypothetical protein